MFLFLKIKKCLKILKRLLKHYDVFDIEFINETKDFHIDWKDFDKKFNKKVKVVSLSHVSNVT